jgi:hypothetical protein
MKSLSTILKALTCSVFILTVCSLAQAQATRTWVSGVGDDANPCSRTAPCKTFAGAISKTATGGEIDAMDFGGFGAVTITKSITIDGGAAFASVLASGGINGIIVNGAGVKVTLRRLSINGTGTTLGLRGVNALQFGQLYVENCYIQNFSTAGIEASVGTSGSVIYVKDTNIQNCPTGISLSSTTGAVGGMIDNVRIENGTNGILAKDRAFLNVRNSVIAIMTTVGIGIQAPSNSAGLNVEQTFIVSTNTGIAVGNAGTRLDLSNSSIMNNTTGVSSAGGTYNSHGNNNFGFNTSDGVAPNNTLGQK